jgi:hypothetical protein
MPHARRRVKPPNKSTNDVAAPQAQPPVVQPAAAPGESEAGAAATDVGPERLAHVPARYAREFGAKAT